MGILTNVYSKVFLLVVLVISALTLTKKEQSFLFGRVAVTPSYKVSYDKHGKIHSAQCRKNGKFVKTYLAQLEIQAYFA